MSAPRAATARAVAELAWGSWARTFMS
jgi:hypothetical protein